jgi:hypothetical protein
MTLLFACACGAIGSNIYYAQPLLVAIAQTFHRTPASLGFLVTATQLGYACALLAIVPLGDVLDRRKLIVRLLALNVLALVAIAVSTNDGICVNSAEFDVGFGVGLGRRNGVGCSLLLQPVELLLHQPKLFLQRGNLRVRGACRLGPDLRPNKCHDHSECNFRTLCCQRHRSALLAVRIRIVPEETDIRACSVSGAVIPLRRDNP